MKHFKHIALIVLTLAFIFSACKKDEQTTPTPPDATTFTDPRDGRIYDIVSIGDQTGKKGSGDQVWFAENLNFAAAAHSSWYDSSSANGVVYGRLYTWSIARVVCPDGWHLPSDEEWKTLEMNLGMSKSEADREDTFRGTDEGRKLKSRSSWYSNGNGSDIVGFNGTPAGYGGQNGYFDFLGLRAYWWSNTVYSHEQAWSRSLGYSNDRISRKFSIKETKYSVRCVKD